MFSHIPDIIDQGMAESEIPGFAVAVAQHGEILWEQAFGWADRERKRAAAVETPFCLASVSKPITATGVMKLVDMGKIELDAPINEYLHPDARLTVWIGDPNQVTVRRVANHTSGLPLHSNGFQGKQRRLKPAMDETIRRYGNIITPPGEIYRYSNIGYGILDHLIEVVSGMSYDDFLRNELFLPLGMTRSAADLAPDIEENAAVRYDEELQPIIDADCDHRGASSVYCSVHDLLLFGMFHLKQLGPEAQTTIGSANIDTMHIPTATMGSVNPLDLNLRSTSQYGVGWVIDDDELDKRISHGGGMGGCASKILLLPEEGIVIATVANRFKPLAYTIEQDILSAMLPGYAGRLAAYTAKHPRKAPAPSNEALHPVPELLGDWAGTVHTYQDNLPLRLSFKTTGEIHAKLGIQLWTLVNEARYADGRLTGRMLGNVNTGDTTRYPLHPFHHIQLDLTLRGKALTGALINIAGSALNHWVELKKAT